MRGDSPGSASTIPTPKTDFSGFDIDLNALFVQANVTPGQSPGGRTGRSSRADRRVMSMADAETHANVTPGERNRGGKKLRADRGAVSLADAEALTNVTPGHRPGCGDKQLRADRGVIPMADAEALTDDERR